MTTMAETLSAMGYMCVRQLEPTGEWIGVMAMGGNHALFVGVDEVGYSRRYCYPYRRVAIMACEVWDLSKSEHPPGPWVKMKGIYKGRAVDELGPGALANV